MSQNTIPLFYFAFIFGFYSACGQSLQGMKTLMANLTSDYDKRIRPANNQTASVSVYVDLILLSLQDLIDAEERLCIVAEMNITWNDENMIWDPSSFENITKVFFTYSDVWVPDLVLSNPYDKISTFGEDWQRITYTYDGNASWYVGNVMNTRCSEDLKLYPSDSQTCTISLYPRGYTYTEVILYKVSDQVQQRFYSDGESWKLLRTSTKTFVNTERSLIEFTLTFSRQPNYVVFRTLFASTLFSFVNVLIFWLPPESDERISCATTLMLTVSIFQVDIDVNLPKWSEMILLRTYLQFELYTSTLITLAIIISTKTYHDDFPKYLRFLHKIFICRSQVAQLSDVDGTASRKDNDKESPHEERTASGQDTDEESPHEERTASSQDTGKENPHEERTASSQDTGKENPHEDQTASIQDADKERKRIVRRKICKALDRLFLLSFFLLKLINIVWYSSELSTNTKGT